MSRLEEVAGRSRCLLIDFDGPLASMFASYTPEQVSTRLREVIRARLGHVPIDNRADPLRLLVEVAALEDDILTRAVRAECRDAEIEAAAGAEATFGAREVLEAAQETGRRVVVVSNNSAEAIDSYLRDRSLRGLVAGVAARTDDLKPELLKPHPYLIGYGLAIAGAEPDQAVFIGDSTTDVEAGRAAGVATVGFANKPGKAQRLARSGADVVTDSMRALAAAIRSQWPAAAE